MTTSIIIYIGYEENNVFQYVILRSARKRNMEYDLLVSDFWMNKGYQKNLKFAFLTLFWSNACFLSFFFF